MKQAIDAQINWGLDDAVYQPFHLLASRQQGINMLHIAVLPPF
jgi:hypothetical protein